MKRSAQVALVVMSAASVGGVSYSMMPPRSCVPPHAALPNAATPSAGTSAAPNAAGQPCAARSSWTSYFHGGRPLFATSDNGNGSNRPVLGVSDSGNSTATTSPVRTAVGGTERGGFGGTSSSMASHGG